MEKDRKVFFLYTCIIAILIIAGFSLKYIFKLNTAYTIAVRVYNAFEYSALAYFFSLYIKNKPIRNALLYSIIPFVLFCIFNYINSSGATLPFIPVAVEYVIMLIFIIYFFFEVMQDPTTEPVYQRAVFWISVAFIINFSGNFFLFLYSKNSFVDEAFQRQYTIIYSTVTIIKDILLSVSAFIKEKPKTISSNPFDSDFEPFKPF